MSDKEHDEGWSEEEIAEYNSLSEMYPYIVQHGKEVGSYMYYIYIQLLQAREDNAPRNAVYQQYNTKEWVVRD